MLLVATYLATDILAGTLLCHFCPARVDESLFRVSSPVYHHDLRPLFSGWARFGPLRYRMYTDSLGFRDRAARIVPADGRTRRILLIGDSFTEGIGLPYEVTYAGIITDALARRGIEVLNAGVVSYAPSIYLSKVRHLVEFRSVRFDHVVVFLDIGDVEDEARHYDLDSHGIVVDRPDVARYRRLHPLPQPAATPLVRLKRGLEDHSLLARVGWTWFDRLHSQSGNDSAGDAVNVDRARWTVDARLYEAYGRFGLQTAAQRLEELRVLLAQRRIAMTLVVYPWPDQVIAGRLDSLQSRFWRRWCELRGVQFIDLFPAFIGGPSAPGVVEECYVRGDIHFNQSGNARAAEAFLRTFKHDDVCFRPEAVQEGLKAPRGIEDMLLE